MKNRMSFEKNKGVFTVGRLLIGLTIGVVAISMLFTVLSFYVEFDSKTMFGSIAQSFVGNQNTFAVKEAWLGIDMSTASIYTRQISLYSSCDRLILLVLLFYVISKISGIVTALEDRKQYFAENNAKAFRHMGHAILIYMFAALVFNVFSSMYLQVSLNKEFAASNIDANAATFIDPFLFIFCFVAAGTAYALSAVFQKGQELLEDTESFV